MSVRAPRKVLAAGMSCQAHHFDVTSKKSLIERPIL